MAATLTMLVVVGGCGANETRERERSQASGETTARVSGSSTEPSTTTAPAYRLDFTLFDTEHPDPGMVRVESIAAAASVISFAPEVPPELGPPAGIFVSRPEIAIVARDRAILLRYDHPMYRLFVVSEARPQIPPREAQATLERLAAGCADGSCAGNWSVVTLADGSAAVLSTGPGSEKQKTNFIAFRLPERASVRHHGAARDVQRQGRRRRRQHLRPLTASRVRPLRGGRRPKRGGNLDHENGRKRVGNPSTRVLAADVRAPLWRCAPSAPPRCCLRMAPPR